MIELIVVIAIITILAGLLLPGLRLARESARAIECTGRMRQCGTAYLSYASDNKDIGPPASEPDAIYSTWGAKLYYGAYLKSFPSLVCPSYPPFRDMTVKSHTIYFTFGLGGHYHESSACFLVKAWNPTRTGLFFDSVNIAPTSLWESDGYTGFSPNHYVRINRLTDTFKVHLRHKLKADILYLDGHVNSGDEKTELTKYYDTPSGGVKLLGEWYATMKSK
jgi:prepilin-type processing-associated H-X9-DG protein